MNEYNAKEFANQIKAATKATATGKDLEKRPMLGNLLYTGDRLVGVDGFRLVSIATTGTRHDGVLLPAKELVKLTAKWSKKKYDTVIVDVRDGETTFYAVGNTSVLKHPEGRFPDVKQIAPKEIVSSVTVRRDDLIEAAKGVSAIAKETANYTTLTVSNRVDIVASEHTLGDIQTWLPIGAKLGADLVTYVNWKFLKEAAEAMSDEKVVLGFSPIRQFYGKDNDGYLLTLADTKGGNAAVIMPMSAKK